MPDENRVFDVARPGHSSPQATSKPVIVGHHPVINDPMVRGDDTPAPTKISVRNGEDFRSGAGDSIPTMEHRVMPAYNPSPMAAEPGPSGPSYMTPESPAGAMVVPPTEPSRPSTGPAPYDNQPSEPPSSAHVQALEPSAHMKRRHPLRWLILILILAIAAAYLLIDSGTIKSSINLPFHIFKQKTAAPAPAATQNQPVQSSLPAGFTKYKLSGTNLTFAAPAAWGTPASNPDPGYSKRGGTNQSDGTHAYIVDFPNNKDVEVAVTSGKLLPASRDTQYYDYLQWCTGTVDAKIYFAVLDFTTASDKTQSPSTTSCDQGPLTDATKLDSSTIFEPAVKNTSGGVLGDLYTKNLNNPDLVVFRVKDAKSANAVQIKQLLSTVTVPAQ